MESKPYILMDIEGTTTPIDFVHKTLFPYSAKHLPDFVQSRSETPDVKAALDEVHATNNQEGRETTTVEEAVHSLLRWIKEDRKHPALKKLQGFVWRFGYESKAYTSELYSDVYPALQRWHEQGWPLGIYSSGSVGAQKLLFQHTEHGDLTTLLSHYFDTGVGGKKEPNSYANILRTLERAPQSVWFLSDVPAELDAAKQNEINTIHLIRPGTPVNPDHTSAEDFDAVENIITN